MRLTRLCASAHAVSKNPWGNAVQLGYSQRLLSAAAPQAPNQAPYEGLPRFPAPSSTGVLRGLDYFGTAVFAVSGSLTAAVTGCDLLGCSMVGTITAVGGGTIRDVLVLRKQPFWTEEWEYLIISVLAAGGAFYCWGDMKQDQEVLGIRVKDEDGGEGELMNWGDAIGVGAFAVIGAMNGMRGNLPFIVSGLCGMMSATFGGAVRDTMLNRPVRILHPYADAYAPIAFATACNYIALSRLFPALQGFRIFSSVGLAVMLRHQSWTNGWRLPFWDHQQRPVSSNVDPRRAATKQ